MTEADRRAAEQVISLQFMRLTAESHGATCSCSQGRHYSERVRDRHEQHSRPTLIEAMRCRSVATKTKRCAVGKTVTMRCRFAGRHNGLLTSMVPGTLAGRRRD